MEGRDDREEENVNANYISILLSRDRLTKTSTKLPHILNYGVYVHSSLRFAWPSLQSLWVQSSIMIGHKQRFHSNKEHQPGKVFRLSLKDSV